MRKLTFILSRKMENFILFVIIINAITLGLETNAGIMREYGQFLILADRISLGIFTIEILLKISYQKLDYFKDPWNIFDFIIVGISYVPTSGGLAVLRSLRVLRVLLLLSILPRLRIIVRSLIVSLPSIASISILISLIFYVSAVIATKIFGEAFPQWFGSLSESLFTLFQIMTLESWAMGIVRPVSQQFPYAFLFFVPFILISSYIILNIFIAIIINAMTEAREQLVKTYKKQKKIPSAESIPLVLMNAAILPEEIPGSQRCKPRIRKRRTCPVRNGKANKEHTNNGNE